MSGIERRLNKVEQAFAPGVSDEVQRQWNEIMAGAPALPAREPDPSHEARWRGVSIPRLTNPRDIIELAQRIAEARRRMYVYDHGQDALDAWDIERERR